MKFNIKTIPFFLITIPAFFLLYNNNYYFGLVEWSQLETDLLIYIIAPVILYVLLLYVYKSWSKAGIPVAFVLVIFYFFQPIQDFLKWLPVVHFIAKYKILLPLLLVIFCGMIVFLRRSRHNFRRAFTYINVLFLVLVLFEGVILIYNSASGKTKEHDLADKDKKLTQLHKTCDTCQKPDVYFFIFDEYTSQKCLQSEFNYGNEKLIDYLRTKGFFVADDSRSNYNFTHMSIASELNMVYLPKVHNQNGYYARDLLKAGYTVYQNEVCKLLKKEGYLLMNYSIFDLEGAPAHSEKPYRDQYFSFILNQTLVKKTIKDIGWNFTGGDNTARVTGAVKKTQEEDVRRIRETSEGVVSTVKHLPAAPVFTYAHFLLPHPPFYFDSLGNRLPELYSYTHLDKHDYIQQLVYANRYLITPLIDSIFKYSSRPFVIMLQGDHGYRNYAKGKEMLEKFNLNAVYFPDKDYSSLYPAISSVNTFRIFFNKYFHAGFPLLKDASFYLMRNPE